MQQITSVAALLQSLQRYPGFLQLAPDG